MRRDIDVAELDGLVHRGMFIVMLPGCPRALPMLHNAVLILTIDRLRHVFGDLACSGVEASIVHIVIFSTLAPRRLAASTTEAALA